jgi:hypothetical protein
MAVQRQSADNAEPAGRFRKGVIRKTARPPKRHAKGDAESDAAGDAAGDAPASSYRRKRHLVQTIDSTWLANH